MFSSLFQNIIPLLITEDYINCRACDLMCPTNAIYPGGKAYILNNKKHKALSMEHYYIVPEKYNLCEGVYEEPECISICPMDAIKKLKNSYE